MARDLTLLSNASATGSWFTWDGGRGTFVVSGTVGGSSIALEMKGANDVATPVGTDVTFTALPGIGNFDLPPCQIRCAVTGGTPSALYARAIKNGEL